MNKTLSVICNLTIVFSLFGCVSTSIDKDISVNLDKLFSAEFHSDQPGGAILIKKNKKIVFQNAYGLADLNTNEKISENTVFNTGSISKTFVSNGILMLSEKGLLSLDDPLEKYFDDFKHKEIAQKVKIIHLLSHTSGLPDNRRVSDDPEFYLTADDAQNFAPIKMTDSLNFEPGEQFEYSNPAFNGLALIIEKITGEKWQKYIHDNIFAPAGMPNSTITDGAHPESGVAHGYELKKGIYVESDFGEEPTFCASGNGGIWSSVTELFKYEQALQDGKIVSKQMLQKSRTVFHPNNWAGKSNANIGYSWFLGAGNLVDEKINIDGNFIYHTGSQGGFRGIYISIPEQEFFLAGLFNRPPNDFNALINRIMQLLFKYQLVRLKDVK